LFATGQEVLSMAGMGRYQKPGTERRNRNALAFDWTTLPLEGRQGPPPPLPPLRIWTADTQAWWEKLWATPQATQWDQSGRTLHTLALLHHHLVTNDKGDRVATIAGEMRQHEDRHGLTPKAMLQLRWRVSTVASDGTAKVLHLVPQEIAERVREGRPDPAGRPHKRAHKSEWVVWAEAHGMERSTAELLTKAKLVELLSSVAEPEHQVSQPPAPDRPPSAALERLREHAVKPKPKRPRKR